ncbi:MAG: rhodanese-like domain-containing protein [Deltaproteobacteria bacterium]|nr:MAG: rhodanese-like domain-containing protein [Deltaproteobacteria bacterium]
MKADELEKRIKSDQALVILDVRSGFEFKSGHIPGAVHAPLVKILEKTQKASRNKEDLLVLTCEHGPRAHFARMLLKWHGYKNLELLNGHMMRWRQSGRLLLKGQQ